MLRSGLAAVLLVVFVSVVVAANTTAWALRTVLDTRTFAATVERSLEAPELERLVAVAVAETVVDRLHELPPQVADEVTSRVLGLPPGSDDQSLEAALSTRIEAELQTPEVRAVRHDVVAELHGYLVGALEGDPGLITVRGRDVVVDVDGVVDRIADAAQPDVATLVRQAGFGADGPVVIAQVAELEPIQDTLDVLETVRVVMPLLAIAVALLIVVVAHRRVRALGLVGLAVAGAGLVSVVVLWLAGGYVRSIPDTALTRDIAAEVYDAFFAVLREQAIALIVVGIALGMVAWFIQRRRRRRAVARMLGPRERAPSA